MFHPSSETPADPQSAATYLRGFIDASPGNDVYADRCLRALVEAVNDRSDIGQLAAEHATAILQVDEIRKALAPFVDLALAERDTADNGIVAFRQFPNEPTRWADVELRHLRALLKAAGLFTDEMLPRPNTPAADAEQAGETTATPAEAPSASVAAVMEGGVNLNAADGETSTEVPGEDESERDSEGRSAQDRYDDDAIEQFGQVELDDPMATER
jgi:hypothetical protein